MNWSKPSAHIAHAGNCYGDFYVEDGCCTACGIPEAEAPEVFGWVEETHCAVVRQPQTHESIDRTLSAMWAAELGCIRYRGDNPDIGRRIVEMGLAKLCDLPPPSDAVPMLRSHVSFRPVEGVAFSDHLQLAQDFVTYFKNRPRSKSSNSHTKPIIIRGPRASVQISWFERNYHTVEFEDLNDSNWLVLTKPTGPIVGIGLSRLVDNWLRNAKRFHDIRWFSANQWQMGGPSRPTVL